IPNNGKQITAVFNNGIAKSDGSRDWYHVSGKKSGDFTIPAGAKNYVVDNNLNGSTAEQAPCKVESSKPSALKTKIVIHYKQQSGDNRNMGVYIWGLKDAQGKEIDGAWHAFNGQDAFGKTYTVEAEG
ncbi:hypothetical protein CG399_07585, partial [Bifidobacteriaceae bacterium NR015]